VRRIVNVTQSADRHAELHGRAFAETRTASVDDADLREVVDRALAAVGFDRGARFVIEVGEPHEEAGDDEGVER
jgi:hypothetical protein